MGETDRLLTAREAMLRAVGSTMNGEVELARLWLDIARELREGSRPRPSRSESVGPGQVVPQADWDRTVAPMPAPRLLDAGQRYEDEPIRRAEHVMQDELDAEERRPRLYAERGDAEFAEEQHFATGSVRPYVKALDDTAVLDAGDPSRCRHCDWEIEPDMFARGIMVHVLTKQRMCPTPPRHTDDRGDESYVSGPHIFAEPGGLPYRAK